MPVTGEFEIVNTRRLNPGAFELTVRAPEISDAALPGQFVHIRCGAERLLRRPISICDAQDGLLRLVIGERGEGTRWLAGLRAGEKVDLLGPLGRGFTIDSGDAPVLLVGGGIGVPPLVFAAKRLSGRAHAAVGFCSKDAVMLVGMLNECCSGVCLSTDDGSAGVHGYVDTLVRKELSKTRYGRILACGPRPMLRAVAACAREFKVPCEVSLEERMGCGVGACLVCACKTKTDDGFAYRHVCSDGPVFNADEVMWDE